MEYEKFNVLEKFYKDLRENLLKENSLKGNSVFTSLIQSSSNRRKDFLEKSAFEAINFKYEILSYLTNQDYLQKIEGGLNTDKYVITAKGIWYLDKEKFDFTEDDLIAFFQISDFEFVSKIKPLNSKEKIVILSLIGVRCFSEESVMDLNQSKYKEGWIRVFEKCYKFLAENKAIKSNNNLIQRKGRSSPVEYIMRRVNDLPKKTSQVYKYTGSKKYYLDIVEREAEDVEVKKIEYLFNLLFRNNLLDIQLIRSTSEFCNNLAYDEARYVKENRLFISDDINNKIYDSLKNNLY